MERRDFLKGSLAAGALVAAGPLPALATPSYPQPVPLWLWGPLQSAIFESADKGLLTAISWSNGRHFGRRYFHGTEGDTSSTFLLCQQVVETVHQNGDVDRYGVVFPEDGSHISEHEFKTLMESWALWPKMGYE